MPPISRRQESEHGKVKSDGLHNPFGDLDDLFKGFMLRPVRFEQQVPQIKMDVKAAKAKYTDGVLKLTLPKKLGSSPGKIFARLRKHRAFFLSGDTAS